MKKRAKELLSNGTVARVVAWQTGDTCYDVTPGFFESVEELDEKMVFNCLCGANLSKYLITLSRMPGKTLAFLKPCDTYSFNQLVKEHRIIRENVMVIAIPCEGMTDVETLRGKGITGVLSVTDKDDTLAIETMYGEESIAKKDAMAERCRTCKSKTAVAFDEKIGETAENVSEDRFGMVAKLEAMTPDERYEFWRGELSRCIRCNACRNVCPACSCEKCVFDNPDSGIAQKAAVNSFEENMFHIIRAFHVAGRCTDCGECSRVCPQNIPLHLLNRKFIKDINEFYGDYQAGADTESRAPLNRFDNNDVEPCDAVGRK